MGIVGVFVQGNGARHADGLTTLPGFKKAHDFAVLHKHVDSGASRRHFSAIKEGQALARFRHQHKRTAAEAGTLGFHQPQHGVGRYHRIHRVAALFKHGHGGLHCIGVGRSGHGAVLPGAGGRLCWRCLPWIWLCRVLAAGQEKY